MSESTRRDIVRELGLAEEKIAVVPNGVLDRFQPGEGRAPGPPYILAVGRRDPYKNLVPLIEAFAGLRNDYPALRLHIIGPDDPRYPEAEERVRALGLEASVRFLGQVDDAVLVEQYQQASLLAFPSSYEGFGLPVLEAMACGTPVVCLDSSSLPEVAGAAAMLVPPNDPEAFGAAIRQVLGDHDLGRKLVQLGLKQAELFSWRDTARQTAALYLLA